MAATSATGSAASSGRVVGAVVGAALAAGLGYAALQALRSSADRRPPPPSAFRAAGRVVALELFPLKSGRGVAAQSLACDESGPRIGQLRDRSFVAVDRNGRFVSGRTHPCLLHVEVSAVPSSSSSCGAATTSIAAAGAPTYAAAVVAGGSAGGSAGGVAAAAPAAAAAAAAAAAPKGRAGDTDGRWLFELHCPTVLGDGDVLTLDPAVLAGKRVQKIDVQNSAVSGVDCGEEAAAWLRRALVEPAVHAKGSAAAELRLVYFPLARTDRAPNHLIERPLRGIYTDEVSYHVVNTASVTALKGRLAEVDSAAVTPRNFRPNILVDGPAAFEEDDWQWVRVGESATFRVHSPCGRCIMTTIDPETGVKSKNTEPLKTLRTFRKPNEAQKKKMGSDTPMMGMLMGMARRGEVAVGDTVYVA